MKRAIELASMQSNLSVIMIGGSGAVGTQVVRALCAMGQVSRISLLVRRELADLDSEKVQQHVVDVLAPSSYEEHIDGHSVGISTLGVGQPSKMSKDDFIRIDRDAVVAFASACKAHGVRHFESLGSVGINTKSSSFYLRTKGQLEEQLRNLGFARLSLFHPSMILTPTNRYGFTQGLTLKVWPLLGPALCGPLRKLRGIRTSELGQAMAHNLVHEGQGVEVLEWEDFVSIAASGSDPA